MMLWSTSAAHQNQWGEHVRQHPRENNQQPISRNLPAYHRAAHNPPHRIARLPSRQTPTQGEQLSANAHRPDADA